VAAKAPVIRGLMYREALASSWLRLVPAWVISGVIHGVIFSLFLLFSFSIAATGAAAPKIEALAETDVEDPATKADLTNPDLGLNPEVALNFNVDRIDENSVAGPVDPTQKVGTPLAEADAPAANVPAPPGFGNGFGGGILSDIPGKAPLGVGVGGGGGLMMPGNLGARGLSGATREKMIAEGGGNAASEAAVANGLLWLALHQAPDGRWSLDQFHLHTRAKLEANAPYFNDQSTGQGTKNDIAGTAFGLLPFLGAGKTHKGDPEGTKAQYNYTKTVEAGLKYLMSKQNKEGDFGGGMYAHGLATITVCEAYGLTSDPVLKPVAQKAVDFIVKAQDPASGGWRYAPRQGGDTSVVGWQVMALKSAQMAGLSVPTSTLKGAEKWLDGNMSSDKGDYGYVGSPATTKDSPATAMTAVGLLCRQYLGWNPRNEGLLNGTSRLKKVPPGASNTMYYYYYATQVMHHMGGDNWEFWNPKMRDHLIKAQDQGTDPKRPNQKGSWDPKGDAHGAAGGRVMITSLSLLTLEVYYRHLPLYRRDLGVMKEMDSK
jgi:hypothetical protein